MAARVGSSSVSCVASPVSSPFTYRNLQLRLLRVPHWRQLCDANCLSDAKVKSYQFMHGVRKLKRVFPIVRTTTLSALPGEGPHYDELESDALEQDSFLPDSDNSLPSSCPYVQFEGSDGRPGLISFYNRLYKRYDEDLPFYQQKNHNNLQWFLAPTVLVTSFFLPSLYLRQILSTIFEDSLLTDFLILFFTEALFYCGVTIFLLIIDHTRRSIAFDPVNVHRRVTPQFGQQVSSVAILVLSLIIPMVTMGFVWPWTGPAASAALAPYLVRIVIQFTFKRYAEYKKSPSLAVIPVIFQAYKWRFHKPLVCIGLGRLHQLNRATQLVTALSFTVRGAEMTSQNLAVNSSLRTLLNVLQFLGLICIWSLSSFLMRFFPSTTD